MILKSLRAKSNFSEAARVCCVVNEPCVVSVQDDHALVKSSCYCIPLLIRLATSKTLVIRILYLYPFFLYRAEGNQRLGIEFQFSQVNKGKKKGI